MYAAEAGYRRVVLSLLKRGAEVNGRDRDGKTALMYAADAGCRAMVQLLLNRGADVNGSDREGKT
eukprot:46834-Eustigmatos_ZCMA.PRE.1